MNEPLPLTEEEERELREHVAASFCLTEEQERRLFATLDRARAERDEARQALEGLTPGGSEYAGDPSACVAFVREVRETQHAAIKTFKARAESAEKERDEAVKSYGIASGARVEVHARARQLAEALRAVEWSVDARAEGETVMCCPACAWWKSHGHSEDCIIGNALAREVA